MNYYTRHTIIEAIEQKLAYLKALDGTLSLIEAMNEPDRRQQSIDHGREIFREKLRAFATQLKSVSKPEFPS